MNHIPSTFTRVRENIEAILPEIVAFRHDIHNHPEVGLKEHRTADTIRKRLQKAGISLFDPLIETDTVALLYGGAGKGKNVTLRADIDALPITEKSGKPWQSKHAGMSHSCGHDGHTAILLGTALVLNEVKEMIRGSVRFVFQPAEEATGGGKMMMEKGLFETEPTPDATFAFHAWPGMPIGSIAATPGATMAAVDRFTITIRGRGGHGARPHLTIDPIITSAQVLQGLQHIVSRSVDPMESAVISVCMIYGGEADNVIPDEVVLKGTVRYFNPSFTDYMEARIRQTVESICGASGAKPEIEYRVFYPPTVNDTSMVDLAEETVKTYVGKEYWYPDAPPSMGAEDFSYYLQKVPGAMLRIGMGEDSAELHNPLFDFNDDALKHAMMTFCALVFTLLS